MNRQMVLRSMPAEIESLKDFCAFVRDGAEASKLTPAEMERLDLVLEELFVNIARYAYAPGHGDVEVGYSVEGPGRLTVQISDSGREFNPLASDPPDFSRGIADRPLGGMGIHLAKIIAASIRYDRSDGRNRLSFTFSGETRPDGL
jgi:anti-sigma regulatory factor (Ser/Thr protein kinase)